MRSGRRSLHPFRILGVGGQGGRKQNGMDIKWIIKEYCLVKVKYCKYCKYCKFISFCC